jgi:phosphoadenosine phosphosulfate reductase
MFQLILKKGFPPTRKIRFCCDHLKERNSIRSFIITGIRWEESVKRGKRKIMETCFKNKRKHYVNPIIDWTKEDVWQYLRENDLPHCELYDPPYNYRRIGCVMCPMGGREGMLKDMRIFPKFANAYLTTFKKLAKLHPDWKDLNTGEELFNWWIRSKAKDNENNFLPFDN